MRLRWEGDRLVAEGSEAEAEAFRAAVAHREPKLLELLRGERANRPAPFPTIADVPTGYGVCLTCGEALDALFLSGDCRPCTAARWKVLVSLGRLPCPN